MSYLALARKWRPRTFSQLIGQDHINKPLMNALTQQRLHHAYLFTGTRGVGKTSVARILAKALNCERGISSDPCLQCDACSAIEQGRFIDLIEIDGASKTRVEDTRELLDNVQYAPAIGRFKIYLIDEVHMLSQHSFNALLKTLEEPPPHVKFILATTDPQKVPVTVLSRCLQFNLKHLCAELINAHLKVILKEEKLDFENEALAILAQAAQGSMRDALSLLDQAITSCSEQLLASDVKTILGYTQQDYALQLIGALAQNNAALLLSLSQSIASEGGHFQYVVDELLNYFHQISIYQAIGDSNPLIKPLPNLIYLASCFTPEDIQLFYQIGLKGKEDLTLAPTSAIGFNMTLLRMITFRPSPRATLPVLALKTTHLLEVDMQKPLSNSLNAETTPQVVPIIIEDLSINTSMITMDTDSALLTDISKASWSGIIPQLKLSGLALNAIENAEFVSKDGKIITLNVSKGHQSLFTTNVIAKIESSLSTYFNSTIKITLNSGVQIHSSPAQQKEQATQKRHQEATELLNNDIVFQQVQKDFSAELVKNSIVPIKDDL